MSQETSEEKTDPASDRKLRKLREDGIVASSSLGPNLMGLAFGLLVAILLLPSIINRFREGFALAFDPATLSNPTDPQLIEYFFLTINTPIAGVIGTILVAAVGFKILINGGFVFAMSHVKPEFSHVSPISGIKKIFKASSLTDFAANLVRMAVLVIVGTILAWYWIPVLVNLDVCVPDCAQSIFWTIVRAFLIACAVLILVSVAFDVGVQKAFFLIEQRMTKTEVKQETKEMLGQPEIRQERRRLQKDTASMAGSVGLNVTTAYFTYGDRVVALAFDPVKTPLPKIAAKARNARETVEMIRRLDAMGIPGKEHEDIVSVCEVLPVGSSIPRSIFQPVALNLRDLL